MEGKLDKEGNVASCMGLLTFSWNMKILSSWKNVGLDCFLRIV